MKKETANSRVKSVLESGFPENRTLNIAEIKELLLKGNGMYYGKDYTEGNLAGVLRTLTSVGFLEKVERGVYQKKTEEKDFERNSEETDNDIEKKIKELKREKDMLEKAVFNMEEIINSIVINVNMTVKEFEQIKNMTALRKAVVEILESYEK